MKRLARALVALASRLLPVQDRRRYEAEFDAEVRVLPRWRQPGYALGVLATAPRLRWVLLAVHCGDHPVLPCWLSVHQDVRTHPNPQDQSVVGFECRHCHRPRDPRQYDGRTSRSTTTYGMGMGPG